MAQQINLHTPVLLAPRLIFSAKTLLLGLGILSIVLSLASGGVWLLQRHRAADHQVLQARQAADRQRLTAALQLARARIDPNTLNLELRTLQAELPRLRERLSAMASAQLAPGRHHSDALALVARTLPESVWLTGVQLAPDQATVEGLTLDPGALQAWLPVLGKLALPKDANNAQALGAVEVQLQGASATDAAAGMATGSGVLSGAATTPASTARTPPPMWRFKVATQAHAGLHPAAPAQGGAP